MAWPGGWTAELPPPSQVCLPHQHSPLPRADLLFPPRETRKGAPEACHPQPTAHSPQQGLLGMCRARLGTSAFLLGAPSLAEILVAGRAKGKPPGGGGGKEQHGAGNCSGEVQAVEKPRACRRERVGERLINQRLGSVPSSPCTLKSSLTLQDNRAQGFCPVCSDGSGSRSREGTRFPRGPAACERWSWGLTVGQRRVGRREANSRGCDVLRKPLWCHHLSVHIQRCGHGCVRERGTMLGAARPLPHDPFLSSGNEGHSSPPHDPRAGLMAQHGWTPAVSQLSLIHG